MIGIYKITERSTGRCYIGQSTNIKSRFRSHKKRFNRDLFDYEVLIQCPVESLDFLERAFINGYDSVNSGLNITRGGNGTFGPMGTKTRQKISITVSGENNPFYGKHHSDEIKKQISASKKGVPWSDARRQAQLNRRNNNDA